MVIANQKIGKEKTRLKKHVVSSKHIFYFLNLNFSLWDRISLCSPKSPVALW